MWLFWVLFHVNNAAEGFSVCLFKRITHIPCPSCGSSRSVIALVKGDFALALYSNPFGYIIAAIMVVLPFWLTYDFVFRKQTLFVNYGRMEYYLKKPLFYVPLVLLVVLNWIWNILKGV